jgi:hypothetical protein
MKKVANHRRAVALASSKQHNATKNRKSASQRRARVSQPVALAGLYPAERDKITPSAQAAIRAES